MKLLKKLVRKFPFHFLKKRLNSQLLAELNRIDGTFNSARVRYVDALRDLYDCLHNVDVSLTEDFKLFRQQRVKVGFRTSQTLADLIWELRTEKSPAWEIYTENVIKDNEVLFIDWYSNASSIRDILDYGPDIIKNYTNYITWKDKIYAEGALAQEEYPPKFYPEEVNFYESRFFKLLVSDLITVYWLTLDSNVSR